MPHTPSTPLATLDRLKTWLTSLDAPGFLALVPPSRSHRGGTIDERPVEVRAHDRIRESGLPDDTAFLGWDDTSEELDRHGVLTRPLTLTSGGDSAQVERAFDSLPEGFDWGRHPSIRTLWSVAPRCTPVSLGRGTSRAVGDALDLIADVDYLPETHRAGLTIPLRPEVVEWLRELLRDESASSAHRATAFHLLDGAGALLDDDLDVASADGTVDDLFTDAHDLRPEFPALINALRERGHLERASELAVRFVTDTDDGGLAGELLTLAPTPDTLALAEQLALTTAAPAAGSEGVAAARLRSALEGTPAQEEGVRFAERLLDALAASSDDELSASLDERIDAIVRELPLLAPAPVGPPPVDAIDDLRGLADEQLRAMTALLEGPLLTGELLKRFIDEAQDDLTDYTADDFAEFVDPAISDDELAGLVAMVGASELRAGSPELVEALENALTAARDRLGDEPAPHPDHLA